MIIQKRTVKMCLKFRETRNIQNMTPNNNTVQKNVVLVL